MIHPVVRVHAVNVHTGHYLRTRKRPVTAPLSTRYRLHPHLEPNISLYYTLLQFHSINMRGANPSVSLHSPSFLTLSTPLCTFFYCSAYKAFLLCPSPPSIIYSHLLRSLLVTSLPSSCLLTLLFLLLSCSDLPSYHRFTTSLWYFAHSRPCPLRDASDIPHWDQELVLDARYR